MFRSIEPALFSGSRHPTGPEPDVGFGVWLLRSLLLAAAYFITGKLGLAFAQVEGQVTLVWPPMGLALAGAIVWGPRVTPGIWLGSFALNLNNGMAMAIATTVATGNTLAPVLAAFVLDRTTGFRPDLGRRRDLLALAAVGVVGASGISALIGASSLALLQGTNFFDAFRFWWAGDAAGALIVTPVILAWATPTHRMRLAPAGPALYFTCLSLGVAASVATMILVNAPFFVFVPFFIVIWSALRFGIIGGATHSLVLAMTAIVCTGFGLGRHADVPLENGLLDLWVFYSTVAIGSLIIASMTIERERAAAHERLLVHELDHRVKNNIAAMIALAEQSGANAPSVDVFVSTFVDRLRASARTHEALARNSWTGLHLEDIARSISLPYVQDARESFVVRGPSINLSAKAAASLTMAMHELATNAAKHGAWSSRKGRITLTWQPQPDDMLEIEWCERVGRMPDGPHVPGFGTMLVQGIVEHELGGEFRTSFSEDGICWVLRLPLREIEVRR